MIASTDNDVQITRRHHRVLAWLVLVAAIAQAAVPLVTAFGPGASPAEGAGPDLLITPAGWAFSIWTLIYVLAIAEAVAVLARRATVHSRRQIAQIVLYLGAAAWIGAAGLESSIVTALILGVMFVAGVVAVVTVVGEHSEPPWFATLTRATIGIYAGWVSAASVLNLSTALADNGVTDPGVLGWQVVMLLVAIVVLLVVLTVSHGLTWYALAGAWALFGIAVTGRGNGDEEIVILAVAGIFCVVAAPGFLKMRRYFATRGTRVS